MTRSFERPRAVIARSNATKQSMRRAGLDCFAALAMTGERGDRGESRTRSSATKHPRAGSPERRHCEELRDEAIHLPDRLVLLRCARNDDCVPPQHEVGRAVKQSKTI